MTMLVELDDEHTKCSICATKFSSDRDNRDPEIRKYLPVLSSSQRCDHWFCHDCVLREQLRVAEENNGRIPKWIKCMHCREKTSFNPAEPKYHRLLIDLLARAQKYAAAQVKNEGKLEQKSADSEHDGSDENAICLKRERDRVDDDDERVVKRSKQVPPSPPLVRVKEEEPSECDDDYSDNMPLQEIENASSTNQIKADFTIANDHPDGGTISGSEGGTVDNEDEPEAIQTEVTMLPSLQVDHLNEESAQCDQCNDPLPLLENVVESETTPTEIFQSDTTDSTITIDAARIPRKKANPTGEDNDHPPSLYETEMNYFTDSLDDHSDGQSDEDTIEKWCHLCNTFQTLDCFSQIQRKRTDYATCKVCIRLIRRTCFICKEEQSLDLFYERELRKGAFAKCWACVDLAKTCSICKVEESLDCFSERQLRKGASAKCKVCVDLMTKRRCSTCNVSKAQKHFSEKQLEKGDSAKCKSCAKKRNKCNRCRRAKEKDIVIFSHSSADCNRYHADGRKKQRAESTKRKKRVEVEVSTRRLLCSTCKEAKKVSRFSEEQLKQGKAASCKKCILSARRLICSTCKKAKKESRFSEEQLKLGEAASCKKCCIQYDSKLAMKSLTEEPKKLHCSTCKAAKKLDCFSKEQQSRGDAASCMNCIVSRWLTK